MEPTLTSDITPDTPIESLATALLNAIAGGNWTLAAVLGLLLLVWGVRKYGERIHPAFGKPKVAPVLAVALSVLATIATAVVAGAPITVGLLIKGLLVALGAMGAWSGAQTLARPAPPLAPTTPTPTDLAAAVEELRKPGPNK